MKTVMKVSTTGYFGGEIFFVIFTFLYFVTKNIFFMKVLPCHFAAFLLQKCFTTKIYWYNLSNHPSLPLSYSFSFFSECIFFLYHSILLFASLYSSFSLLYIILLFLWHLFSSSMSAHSLNCFRKVSLIMIIKGVKEKAMNE